MRCEDVESKLLELIEGELPAVQRSEVLTHLDGCAACTAEVSAYRDLLALVQVDPVPEPSPVFWKEFLPSLQQRIAQQEVSGRKPTQAGRLTDVGSWFAFRPRFIAGLAVAAASIFLVVRLPGVLPVRTNQQAAPTVMEKVAGQNGSARNAIILSAPNRENHQSGERLIVAGEVIDEPSILIAAIQRLGGIDEIADRLETAWAQRPEFDSEDSLASLNEEERQALLDHLSHVRWSEI
jgi:hypothetical protein